MIISFNFVAVVKQAYNGTVKSDTKYVFAASCPSGWHAHGADCYQPQEQDQTMDQARITCQALNAVVATPRDSDTNTFLQELHARWVYVY